MSLYSALTEKPWEGAGLDVSGHEPNEIKTRRTGLKVLLSVVSVLFFLLFVAFLMRSQYPDWQPLAEEPSHPLFDMRLLWINSLFLLMASLFIEAARRLELSNRLLLLLAGACCCAFVIGQYNLWQSLMQQGFMVDNNPAISFFYLFTGVHAAHVLVGIVVWWFALSATVKAMPNAKERIGLCATYWHFLLALWVGLFWLLTSKPETYDAIAAFCGIGGVA